MREGMCAVELGDGVAMIGDRLLCDEILPKASAFGDVRNRAMPRIDRSITLAQSA